MRVNKYVRDALGISRRAADDLIVAGKITVNQQVAHSGQDIAYSDEVIFDNQKLKLKTPASVTILLNKPVGYVCSRDGQGSPTVYDLIPEQYHNCNIAGRLDKDSSGLVVLTNDGNLLNEITHPSNNKQKVYEVEVDRELSDSELKQLKIGIDIGDDRPSKFQNIVEIGDNKYEITMSEGRNRQIRRSFEAIDKKVISLHRINLGSYSLGNLDSKEVRLS